jgi:hypothetical protein
MELARAVAMALSLKVSHQLPAAAPSPKLRKDPLLLTELAERVAPKLGGKGTKSKGR